MKIPGSLAILALVCFVLQFAWPVHARFGQVPNVIGVILLAIATVWGLVRGPAAVRFTVFLWVAGIVVVFFAAVTQPVTMGGPGFRSGPDLPILNPGLAYLSVALWVLSAASGLWAYRREARVQPPSSDG